MELKEIKLKNSSNQWWIIIIILKSIFLRSYSNSTSNSSLLWHLKTLSFYYFTTFCFQLQLIWSQRTFTLLLMLSLKSFSSKTQATKSLKKRLLKLVLIYSHVWWKKHQTTLLNNIEKKSMNFSSQTTSLIQHWELWITGQLSLTCTSIMKRMNWLKIFLSNGTHRLECLQVRNLKLSRNVLLLNELLSYCLQVNLIDSLIKLILCSRKWLKTLKWQILIRKLRFNFYFFVEFYL